ncbi:TetR/AcrR family transcriptional regulator [Paracoccus binzhouensis]|uniref:TetR/AcrR family transcriptional regulator n=1 Tax=Paracoccus binzhouensis TaxID=2796149 RepID=UPI001E3509F6|nr:TetR/AcrR family transcriptional regulator [Paracoccus binzhouensis]
MSEPSSQSPSRPPGGSGLPEPEDSPKRRQILDGARRMFLAQGFEGASMQDVARAAGVSKGTLYVYFDSKEAMFEALVLTECGRLQRTIRQLGAGVEGVEHELRQIARSMIDTLLQDEVMAAMRMMIGAGEKFPDLARQIYEAGPMRSIETLAEYFALRVARGDLAMEDCREAGAEFVDLVLAGLQRRALLMMPPLSDAGIDAFVRRRVARFLAVYAPGPAAGGPAR